MKYRHRARIVTAFTSLLFVGLYGVPPLATAAPAYTITDVYVPPDQYAQGGKESALKARPIYKPHDSRTTLLPRFWISSNERTGCAGITTLSNGSNKTLAKVIIDEPDVEYHGGGEEGPTTCVGSIEPPPAEEPPEGTPPAPEDQFPAAVRFNPSLCLPIVLPPGQDSVRYDVENPDGSPFQGQGQITRPRPRVRTTRGRTTCAPPPRDHHRLPAATGLSGDRALGPALECRPHRVPDRGHDR